MTQSTQDDSDFLTFCTARGTEPIGTLDCRCQGKPVVLPCEKFGQCIIHAPRRPYPMDLVLSNGDRTRLKLQDKLHVCMFCEDRVEPPACDVLDQSSPICVVTAYTRNSAMWNSIGSFAAARTKAYCVANGYDYRCHMAEFDEDINPSWCRLRFIRDALETHDTVFWLDGDAMFTNHSVRIEDLHTTSEDIAMCTDAAAPLNAGVMILRKSPFTRWFLDAVWNERHSNNRLWEQDTINRMFRHGHLAGHLRVYAPRDFNSCVGTHSNGPNCDWQPGDVIAHAYATSNVVKHKLPALQKVAEKCSRYTTDHPALRTCLPKITVRNLIYHAFPTKQNGVFERNAYQLRQRLDVFNGRKIISIATGADNCHTVDEVKAMLPGCEYIVIPNDAVLCEVASFPGLLKEVENTNPHEATFYAHAKGNSSNASVEGVARWRNAMYHHLLDRVDDVTKGLLRYPMVGVMKLQSDEPPWKMFGLVNSKWMFSGTFFWFRHDAVFLQPNWATLHQDRFGVEAWPGGLFPTEDALSLYNPWNQDAYGTFNTYSPNNHGPEFDDPR